MKIGVAAVIGIGFACVAMPARARHGAWTRAESPACTAAHRQALERLQEARLQEAHELFATCARATCSDVIRGECTARRTRLEADIPSWSRS